MAHRKACHGGSVFIFVVVDIHAVDGEGNEADIEIQQNERGAGFKRARHNDRQLSLEKIAQYSGLSIEKVRGLAEKKSA